MSLVAAGTRNVSLLGSWCWELQEFAQRYGACVMHSGTHRHLDGFQIQTAGLTGSLEEETQQSVYFARGLAEDDFRRFFS
jgi:hypothetical protein